MGSSGLTMTCHGHEIYRTKAAAEQALRELVAAAKRTGRGGKSYKRLNVWPCGDHFHVGRSSKLPKNYEKPAAALKPASPGDYRRKLERIDKAFARMEDHFRRMRLAAIEKIAEEDRRWLESARVLERERAEALKDLEDSECIAKQMTGAVVFVK